MSSAPRRSATVMLLRDVASDEIVPARGMWTAQIGKGQALRIVDLEGQQAVDFLCFRTDDPSDRYNAANTIKVGGSVYIGLGSILYADSGAPLLKVIGDSIGRHDTVYGCCSEANNRLRYGKPGGGNCYDNFAAGLARHDLDRQSIVANVNFFMQVPIDPDGSAGVAATSRHRAVSWSCRRSAMYWSSSPTARRC